MFSYKRMCVLNHWSSYEQSGFLHLPDQHHDYTDQDTSSYIKGSSWPV